MRHLSKSVKVLHISPHLGGGVGRVLVNFLVKSNQYSEFRHSVLCFDYINENAKRILSSQNVEYKELLDGNHDLVLKEILSADIVLIHLWNHPMLYNFLVRNVLPESRVLMWCHVSGNEPPQLLNSTLFNYADYFVFTTPISYLVNEVVEYRGDHSKFKSIWSSGGLEHVKSVQRISHDGLNVGYIGTVDYVKLYPNIIDLCSKINIPGVHFYFCGGASEGVLKSEVVRRGVSDRFTFTGYIDDIQHMLGMFDIFGYALSPNHYGTCDQALAEAMAVGIVPVVFNNNMENFMVHHMYSGIVAQDEEQYIKAILELNKNKKLYKILSENARHEALRRFSDDATLNEWESLFKEIIKKPKIERFWGGSYAGLKVKPFQVFLEAIGCYSHVFAENDDKAIKELALKSYSWQSKTKGTAHHYANYYKYDDNLNRWSELMKSSL